MIRSGMGSKVHVGDRYVNLPTSDHLVRIPGDFPVGDWVMVIPLYLRLPPY